MQILINGRERELADIRAEMMFLKEASDIGYNFEAQDKLRRLEAKETHIINVATWYRGVVNAVLDQAGRHQTLVTEKRDEFDRVTITVEKSPADILTNMVRRYGDLSYRLKAWCAELVNRELLTPAFVATLDFTEPVDQLAEKERQEEYERRQQWDAGYAELKAAVIAHGKRTGNSWAFREFLNVYNAKGPYRKDEVGLMKFSRGLQEKKLLPGLIDRFTQTFGDLSRKLKEVISHEQKEEIA